MNTTKKNNEKLWKERLTENLTKQALSSISNRSCLISIFYEPVNPMIKRLQKKC